ncbi:MAG: CopG family transcriptional regulator [Tepidisphaeraceae bacterium]
MANNPMCLRISDDLRYAVDDLAAKAGLSTSEWIRTALFQIVYGEPPGIDQGYMAGRQIGFRMMQAAFHEAWGIMPTTIEEAMVRLGGNASD